MKWMWILCLVGCTPQLVETQTALVQTRGVPVVQMVIEGPGGDLVPVNHQMVKAWIWIPWGWEWAVVAALLLAAGLVRRKWK